MVSRIVIFVILVHFAHAYPTGAPAAACDQMFPIGHGVDAQTGTPPFNITLSANTFRCDEDVTVTLGGSVPFKGFLCQPRPTAATYLTSGKLTPSGTTPMKQGDCGTNAALTHTNRTLKNSAEFKWTPPTNKADKMNIYIVCTVVQEKVIFWQKLSSSVITYIPNSECPTSDASHMPSALMPILLCSLVWAFLLSTKK